MMVGQLSCIARGGFIMVKEKVDFCIAKLNDILSSEFPLGYYSIGGYGDEAVCIQSIDL